MARHFSKISRWKFSKMLQCCVRILHLNAMWVMPCGDCDWCLVITISNTNNIVLIGHVDKFILRREARKKKKWKNMNRSQADDRVEHYCALISFVSYDTFLPSNCAVTMYISVCEHRLRVWHSFFTISNEYACVRQMSELGTSSCI